MIMLYNVKGIDISSNNEIKTVEFGDLKYINEKSNLSIVEIKENLKSKINFFELDDILYKNKEDIIYNNEPIYIINSKNKDITVSYGRIKNNIGSKIIYSSHKNMNNKFSLIFNLSNNKLIGICDNHKNIFSKGITFDVLIKKPINTYENSNICINEIDILVKVYKEEVDKKIFFLDNYNDKVFHNFKNNFKESNETNTEIYINNNKVDNKNYFVPENEGEYKIKLKFSFLLGDCSYMFAGCDKIKGINFISFDTKYVKSMKYMFYKCSNIKYLNLLSFITNRVTDMSYMFYLCNKLKNIDLSSFNTKKDIILLFYIVTLFC